MDDMERAMRARASVTPGWRAIAAMAWLLAAATASHGAAREFQVQPPAAWVNRVAVPLQAQAAPGTTRGGVQYLLADRQVRLAAHDRVSYNHYAQRAVTGDGVEDAAHVEVSFDPSYETLTFHAITLYRDGRAVSRLDPAKVRVLQREKDLEARIYDGRKTASVMLDDVRIGDVVEYSYTLQGANPALRDRSSGSFDLQWKVPLQALYARLVVPEDRPVTLVPRNTRLVPDALRHDGVVDYRWRADGVQGLDGDDDEPGWYDPYPSVQWTEFPDWASVVAWALPLYGAAPDQGAALQAQVDAIARASADPGERLLATLRFVQREVRYLGIEVGVGSLAPRPPRDVFQRRFGDCKDKALLMAWMLHALDISAQPALVNTRITRGLDGYAPSAGLFDHVVVHASVGGHDYWLDPTLSPQKGTLATVTQAAFERALVVDPATTALTPMIARHDLLQGREVHTVFDATGGRGKPVRMDVTTTYVGASADGVRDQLASDSHEALQRRYLNFYASYYPQVAVRAPFSFSDDDAANQVVVVEHYTVGDVWKRSDDDKRYVASFHSPEIDSQLQEPGDKVRRGPLARPYPQRVTAVTEIRLDKDWPVDIAPLDVQDNAFRYDGGTTARGSVVTTIEHLQSLVDEVPADGIASYVEHVRKVRDSLVLRLYLPDANAASAGGGVNLPVALLALVMAAGVAWLARWGWRYDPAPRAAAPGAPSGLGGWLVLPGLGMVLGPFTQVAGLWRMLPSMAPDTWSRLTVAGEAHYSAWWAPLILFELGMGLLLAAWAGLLLVLHLRRRTSLPRAWLGYMLLCIAYQAFDQAAMSLLPVKDGGSDHGMILLRLIVQTALWGSYFMNSQRVAATFVVRLRPEAPVEPPASSPGVATAPGAPEPDAPTAG